MEASKKDKLLSREELEDISDDHSEQAFFVDQKYSCRRDILG